MNIKIWGVAAIWLAWCATAYCATVVPHHVIDCTPPFKTLFVNPHYRVLGGETDLLMPFFWLAHIPDRLIRPDVWNPDSN